MVPGLPRLVHEDERRPPRLMAPANLPESLVALVQHGESNPARLARLVLMFVGAVEHVVSGREEEIFPFRNILLAALVRRFLFFLTTPHGLVVWWTSKFAVAFRIQSSADRTTHFYPAPIWNLDWIIICAELILSSYLMQKLCTAQRISGKLKSGLTRPSLSPITGIRPEFQPPSGYLTNYT
ncbi:hypothetical protein OIDMADRAFT_180686 [Oidiodendron maius Zn]|uniref:Uncharacterized protein n=1 Tax=Oidiodendron maius (strain Zn) TaxID=913774 RepID=A0A0C3DEP6_OIDMZ|nr:hypothetical protein OIDMADRAFT_180686 [Oidiodendron maius Zn]